MLAVGLILLTLGSCLGTRLRDGVSSGALEWLQDLDDFGIDDSAWLGFEQGEDHEQEKAKSLGARNLTGVVAASNASGTMGGAYPPVLMLGMFNTGTNLLAKLMGINFPGSTFGAHDRYTFEGVSGGGLHIWKHSKPEHLRDRMTRQGTPNIFKSRGLVTVAVTRDPLSWVQSMRKAPYDLAGCMRSNLWQSKSCTFPAPYTPHSGVIRPMVSGHSTSFHVPNIESVWNDWTRQYDNLGQYGFDPSRTVVLSYEQIVLDTQGSLAKIAAAMGKPAPDGIRQVHTPAKIGGKPNGRAAALQKLHTKSYLQQYSSRERREVCERLDRPLMKSHGYDDCHGWL